MALFMQLTSSSITLMLRFIALFALCHRTKALMKLPPNVSVPAVIAFGDSIVDSGNNNNIKTFVKCNFPPYGKDFEGGVPTGRFCNGKIPSDILVEEFGIKEYLPAYLDPNLKSSDLVTGVGFASGASGYDPLTPQIASVIPLSAQLDMFREYIGKLKGIVGEERTNFILANSLFVVVAGSDDIANTYFIAGVRQLQYDVPAYTDLMLNSASNFVKELYKLGARRIAVLSAPPIGCVPSQRTLAGGLIRVCAEKYNDAAKLFNSKLSKELDSLHRNSPNSRIVYIDVYNPLLDIILNYQKYGYKVVDRGCCGTGKLEVAVLCNPFHATCPNASEYVFWDSYHPTEGVYRRIISQVLQKYITQLVSARLNLPTIRVPITAAANAMFPAVFAFGDSVLDTGNNNRLLTLTKCNFPPYGRDFFGGIPTGRFCDGKVPSDFIAGAVGVKELLPAYLDPNLGVRDLVSGVSFASGGSGNDNLTSSMQGVLSLSAQLRLFEDYITRLRAIVGVQKTAFIITNSLYLFSSGNNDIALTYPFTFRATLLFPTYADLLVGSASNFLRSLYQLGARHVWTLSTMPLGCLPGARTAVGGPLRWCQPLLNLHAQIFNGKLSSAVLAMRTSFPNFDVRFIDIYTLLLNIIQNPLPAGFINVANGCCGTGAVEVAELCNIFSGSCLNPSAYVFWDSGHPTQRACQLIVSAILQEHNVSRSS